ncbi:MAG: hypothetical protein K2H64_10825 [Desulfovibrio sp.]|nr:hypothetical protein [Desulfovibrio sp.]
MRKSCLGLLIPLALLTTADAVFASDYVTFESFYMESGLWSWVIGISLAVLALGAVIMSAGAASPIVAGIGSAVGSMMGLSGAAATSAGLAFLGGGSLAVGGYGMLGGTVLLTTILEGGFLAGSQYLDAMRRAASYQELCEQTKDYPNFPPFKNTSGPSEIGGAVKILERGYNTDLPPSSSGNLSAVRSAINELLRYRPEQDRFYKIGYKTVIRHEQLRVEACLALLYFMDNDYKAAYRRADSAMRFYQNRDDDGPASVPQFIKATAGLVTGDAKPSYSLGLFSSAVSGEKDSPILPLLYTIYISRAGAADCVNSDFLKSLLSSTGYIADSKTRSLIDTQLLMAAVSKVWQYGQNITTISQNIASLNLAQAKDEAARSLAEYKACLTIAKSLSYRLPRSSPDERIFAEDIKETLDKYEKGQAHIEKLAAQIAAYSPKPAQKPASAPATPATRSQSADNTWIIWCVLGGIALLIIVVIAVNRKKKHTALKR